MYLGTKSNQNFASIMSTDQFYNIVTFCVKLIQRKLNSVIKSEINVKKFGY